jgi:hypothetical protein
MDDPSEKILIWCMVLGFFATVFGCSQCISGHNFAVAAEHEATVVGRVTKIVTGSHGSVNWRYVFTVNGVNYDDYSPVCRTPLEPGACERNGRVLVYYSFQPIQNSRLQDFRAASAHSYGYGQPLLAIGLPVFLLAIAAEVVLSRKPKSKDERDRENEKGASESDEIPDEIHIVPGE